MVLNGSFPGQGETLRVEKLVGSVQVWRGWLSLTHRGEASLPREGGGGPPLSALRLGELIVDTEVSVSWWLGALSRDSGQPRHHRGGSEVRGEGLVRHSLHCLNTVARVRRD